ncbi:hypothetical protein QBC40DRAFT_298331 [Triangularia verruculosa]|uniref:Uncharacterized protein n=1 Tax=Triangularia verruculosa TaxID=2587418 RepID=A0AAN7ATZ4_9PEZI|nr:hypothetical protein QBC40DRAFT_298331 [Triangularia verruculosa]
MVAPTRDIFGEENPYNRGGRMVGFIFGCVVYGLFAIVTVCLVFERAYMRSMNTRIRRDVCGRISITIGSFLIGCLWPVFLVLAALALIVVYLFQDAESCCFINWKNLMRREPKPVPDRRGGRPAPVPDRNAGTELPPYPQYPAPVYQA